MLTFPHDYTSPDKKCVLRINSDWYDLTAWRHLHPGGAQFLDRFHNQDATDAFNSIHSQEALDRLKNMKSKPADESEKRDTISIDFENFRQKLIHQGLLTRRWHLDFLYYLGPTLLWLALGTYIAHTYPLLAIFFIGLGMQQAGWLGHDYVHGRGKVSEFWGNALGGCVNGFSSRWWSLKHNSHHTWPNRKEFDADIHNEPILHLWFPDEDKDVWFRKYQYLYFPIAYSFLYVSWRMQSIQFVLGSRNWAERTLIAINYCWLAYLGPFVALGSILLGGLFVALVVTANHQPEPMFEPSHKYNFIVDQFVSTRNVLCPDFISEYFFGGMQYQLEHHLFPFMPKYNFPTIRPLVMQFAHEHGLEYKISGIFEIMMLNIHIMKKYSSPKKPQ